MKKQFIAKLLALVLVLTMLPVAVFAEGEDAPAGSTAGTNVGTGSEMLPTDMDVPPVALPTDESENPAESQEPTPAESEEPTPAEPEVVETIEDVKTETTEDGQTIVTATIEVTDDTAPVEVTETAVEALAEKASEGDVVTIVAPTTGEVTVPAGKLAEVVAKTGNPVSVGNSVASVAVDAALLEVAGDAPVTVAPVANEDGTITVTVKAGDQEIAPEDVEGGIAVQVPVDSTDDITAVYVVLADGTRVEVEFEVVNGQLQVKLTVSGNIEISRD